jgi:hypothetical protein
VLSGSTCEEQDGIKDTVVLAPLTTGVTSSFITQEPFGDRINITTIQTQQRTVAVTNSRFCDTLHIYISSASSYTLYNEIHSTIDTFSLWQMYVPSALTLTHYFSHRNDLLSFTHDQSFFPKQHESLFMAVSAQFVNMIYTSFELQRIRVNFLIFLIQQIYCFKSGKILNDSSINKHSIK